MVPGAKDNTSPTCSVLLDVMGALKSILPAVAASKMPMCVTVTAATVTAGKVIEATLDDCCVEPEGAGAVNVPVNWRVYHVPVATSLILPASVGSAVKSAKRKEATVGAVKLVPRSTALMIAALRGHVSAVSYLVEHNANLNATNKASHNRHHSFFNITDCF